MKILIVALLLFVSTNNVGYKKESLLKSIIQCTNYDNRQSKYNYILVMVSHPLCSPCKKAISQLSVLSNKVDFLIIEYGDDSKRDALKLEYPKIEFIKPNSCFDEKLNQFFPVLELSNINRKVLWSKKGWENKYLEKIERIIQE